MCRGSAARLGRIEPKFSSKMLKAAAHPTPREMDGQNCCASAGIQRQQCHSNFTESSKLLL